jgi:hypothetical protein
LILNPVTFSVVVATGEAQLPRFDNMFHARQQDEEFGL